ncbi:hypothetical protein M438DRAFT_95535 [Aureobasidium pullulans EXF-150]|uniref:Uncharacterized protein n=1 Tax=Aureobasidium pullulans EXF-150 TaxID=1043002 RepID=A0A074XTU7_AURPU|nr:uncharacterized protein M438DRAFT_95535 [Aureobasidium pullulans EXF-150]KEQ89013.1 hypothetical protein M438DRAFT_95535 [Aureobasidium pullulans EXF-150]
MWYASNDSNVLSFFLPSFLLPRPSRKLSPPHDIPRCSTTSSRVLRTTFSLTRYSIPVTPVPKNSFLNNCRVKWPSQVQNVPDRQYAIKRLAVLSFERCLDPTNPLVRTRSLKTRELIPEDVKFFNSTVNASTAIVRGYICLRLLAYFRKRKIL